MVIIAKTNLMLQEFIIKINSTLNANSTIELLSKIDIQNDLLITIHIDCVGFISADVYLIIVSFIKDLRASGKNVQVKLAENQNNCPSVKYASRIDFFKHLEIDYKEDYNRHSVTGKLIPIINIESGMMDLSQEILEVFSKDFNMSKDDVQQISLIISEMFCNTSIHSKSKSGAYLFCQKYNGKMNHLEFILVDSGIGIQKSLQKNEDYIGLSNAECLNSAIEYEVTCGNGRGHGLYFASEFLKRNNGTMLLLSGENSLSMSQGTLITRKNSSWNGVYLKFCFKFDSVTSLSELMEEKNYSNTHVKQQVYEN